MPPPSATVDDYLQQIGRAGRGGQQSHAIMLYSAQQLRNVEAGMLNVLKNKEKCIRELCLQEFEQKKATFEPPHLCCGFCASECHCGSCGLDQNSFETFTSTQELEEDSDGEQFIRTVTPDNDHDLLRELTALKKELDRETLLSRTLYVAPDIIHGLSEEVVQVIHGAAAQISSVDDVIDKCNISQYSTACRIVRLFSNIFGDMDIDIFSTEDLVLQI